MKTFLRNAELERSVEKKILFHGDIGKKIMVINILLSNEKKNPWYLGLRFLGGL